MMMPVLHCTVCARCLSRRHLRFELRRTRLQRSYPELGIRATRVVRSTVPWRVLSLPVLRTRTPATRPDVRTCVVATSWDTRQPECVFSSTVVTCSLSRAFLHVLTRTSIDLAHLPHSRIFLTPASTTLSGVSSPRLVVLQIATQSMSMHRTASLRSAPTSPNNLEPVSLQMASWLSQKHSTDRPPASRSSRSYSSGLPSSLASAAPHSLLPLVSPEVVAPLFRVAWRGRDVDVQDRSPSLNFTGI